MLDPVQTTVAANAFDRQWEDARGDVLAAVERVGRSGRLVLGPEVEAFEREFAAWWGVPYAVGVASGLDALEIALRCADVRAGDRVLTTPLTAFATTLAILRAGAEPVWGDVDASGGLDLDRAAAALESDHKIRAVLPVHLYGHPLDPDRLSRLARAHGVAIVEDCAQSAGAERGQRPTGLAGIVSATSLYPTKNLGAMGDGGVVLTVDSTVAERARRLRDYGQARRYVHVESGLNSRLDELQAAILRSAHLPRLDGWLSRRRAVANRYERALKPSGLQPLAPAAGVSGRHLFPVEATRDAASIERELTDRAVAIGRHYPTLCPDQPVMRGRGTVAGSIDVARGIAARELSLPIHPYLRDDEVQRVIDVCLEVSGG